MGAMMSKPQCQAGVRLPPHDWSARPPWERGCAFLVTAGADLVPDNAASTWIDTALCELEAGAPVGTARLAADALACLAKLASACSRPQAERLVQMVGPPATATAVRARDHARIFLSIAREHPALGPALVRDLCRALPTQDEIVAVVPSEGESVLTQHPEAVRDECQADVPAEGHRSRARWSCGGCSGGCSAGCCLRLRLGLGGLRGGGGGVEDG